MAKLNQLSLLEQSMKAYIVLREEHELIQITKLIDWDRLMEIAINSRESRVKKATGSEPHYRELLGAVVLMALKNITYRQAEDLVAHYAPARYLCDLMDSTWQPDHITIFEFTQMLGAEGVETINTSVLNMAREKGLLDTKIMMSDTTAQEARIPYPTEVGLMSTFIKAIAKNLKKSGQAFSKAKEKIKKVVKKVKGLTRTYHLFAKTKEAKKKVSKKIYHTVSKVQKELEKVFSSYSPRAKSIEELKRLT